ncbi:hypothetical protein EJ05DRAFT_296886 [Pseudovirgaria hyperparasitica]|uniref:Uncharacterized protein n=1 Tax=Pseudovirgaria hyperparasitica TaxID=470096 RepID=A0A6A6VRK5_9PEZI|nr:uncharacterized protein EJ05DRAFT_296886 [Pseudovirgaria hyperparasitica]KAF2752539.1 hypothetical protein EJ05DRAFT_296886 [Pseudovirgaria hyperparasitica]
MLDLLDCFDVWVHGLPPGAAYHLAGYHHDLVCCSTMFRITCSTILQSARLQSLARYSDLPYSQVQGAPPCYKVHGDPFEIRAHFRLCILVRSIHDLGPKILHKYRVQKLGDLCVNINDLQYIWLDDTN